MNTRIDRASVIERVSEHSCLIAPIVASLVRKSNCRWLSWPDLTQAGFVGLLKACNSDEYDASRASFSTYASRKIEYAVRDAIKSDRPAPLMQPVLVGEPVDLAPLPDAVYELREALGSLTLRQREAIELLLSGYTRELAAKELGTTRVAVTQLRRRALTRLRQLRHAPARPVRLAA